MRLEILPVDPEWTVWALCPNEVCTTVAHSCCEDHLRSALEDHYTTIHS